MGMNWATAGIGVLVGVLVTVAAAFDDPRVAVVVMVGSTGIGFCVASLVLWWHAKTN